MKPSVGVVGAKGDLGRQLVRRLRKSVVVMTCDIQDSQSSPLKDVLEHCDIVHFCVPPEAIRQRVTPRTNQIIVLHDSIMRTSMRLNRRWFKDKASIVHLLMNKEHMAIVESQTAHLQRLTEHLLDIGFKVKTLNFKQHDRLIARSQAPLALLLHLLPELDIWHEQGLLTASAEDLRAVLGRRSVNWTPSVVQALLRNKELKRLVRDLRSRIL